MSKITLSKALKLKNRLVGRLNSIQEDISTYNSVLIEQKDKVNVSELLESREKFFNSLVAVKLAIVQANSDIQIDLILIGELKSTLSWLQNISTRDGKERHGYQNTSVEYCVTLNKKDVSEKILAIEKEIDSIQDRIDKHNYTTELEIPQEALDLAS